MILFNPSLISSGNISSYTSLAIFLFIGLACTRQDKISYASPQASLPSFNSHNFLRKAIRLTTLTFSSVEISLHSRKINLTSSSGLISFSITFPSTLQINEATALLSSNFPTTIKSVIGSKSCVNNSTVLPANVTFLLPTFLNILCRIAYFLLVSNEEIGSSKIIKSESCKLA